MKGGEDRIMIAEIPVIRLIFVTIMLMMVIAVGIQVGLSEHRILFVSDPLAHGAVKFTAGLVTCVVGLFHLGGYLNAARVNRGVGLYAQAGRLVWISTRNWSVRIEDITAIQPGPEGVFVGEPRDVTFELAHGEPRKIRILFVRTPFEEMVRRLRSAGVSAVVREMPKGDRASKDEV